MKWILILLALAACAPQEPIYRPVTVPMSVEAPCRMAVPPAPASLLAALSPNASLFRKVQAMLIELDLRKDYEAKLHAALAECS
jgi:hypothetical protein